MINARLDVYLAGQGTTPSEHLEESVRWANAYLAAGADCVFVPGVVDASAIQPLTRQVQGPVNIMAFDGSLSVASLQALGVARVSLGSVLAQAAYSVAQWIAEEALVSSELAVFQEFRNGETFGHINGMMD